MKTIILVTTLLMGTLASADIAPMKKYLPDGTWAGKTYEGYACQLEVKWVSDVELNVKAFEQYKSEPMELATEITFLDSKKPEMYCDELNETDDELSLSQATVLFQEDECQVDLYEQIALELEYGYKFIGIGVSVAEVDHESDPHEFTIYCHNLKKIK